MNKKLLASLALTIASFSTVSATNIILSGATMYLSDESNVAVPAGSYLSVGYFSDSFTDFAGLATRTWSSINAADYTELFTSSVNPAGSWSGSSTHTGIQGKKLFVWAFSGAAAPTVVNDQRYGLFTGSDAEWTAEGDTILPPSINSLSISIVNDAKLGTILVPGVSIALVPEPSTYAMFAGALALGYVMIRRRR